jgi:hypothetical protein
MFSQGASKTIQMKALDISGKSVSINSISRIKATGKHNDEQLLIIDTILPITYDGRFVVTPVKPT